MKNVSKRIVPDERPLTGAEFMESFNANMPAGYPHVTPAILIKFKEAYPNLFRKSDVWTLDLHRKRMIEWLPQNL